MKTQWTAPKLTVHGTVESITAGKRVLKGFGGGDDFAATISTVR